MKSKIEKELNEIKEGSTVRLYDDEKTNLVLFVFTVHQRGVWGLIPIETGIAITFRELEQLKEYIIRLNLKLPNIEVFSKEAYEIHLSVNERKEPNMLN